MINFLKVIAKSTIEWLLGRKIKAEKFVSIKRHKKATSDGFAMQQYVNMIRKFCNFYPQNVYEIGANFGQDAEYLRKSFSITPSAVHVFEAHPQICQSISEMYKFNVVNKAVSNSSGSVVFNAANINTKSSNTGISSLREHLILGDINFSKIKVDSIRMDDYIKQNNVQAIDILKVDVEGMNYEVLEGFGSKISIVKTIQTEGEYSEYWRGQKLFPEIEKLLKSNNFRIMSLTVQGKGIQLDSFWINEKYLLNR